MGEEAVISALLLALYQAYMHAQTHISHVCEASPGSQSAALKASSFLPLIAGSICHWGVEFLISALTERGKMGICGVWGVHTKWMQPANKWNQTTPSSFLLYTPAGTMLLHFSSLHIKLFSTKQGESLLYSQLNSEKELKRLLLNLWWTAGSSVTS